VFEKKILRRISESWFIWHWMIPKNSINRKLTALHFCVPSTASHSTESESSKSKSWEEEEEEEEERKKERKKERKEIKNRAI